MNLGSVLPTHVVRCVCNLLHVLMSLLRGGHWLPRGEYSTEIYLDLELIPPPRGNSQGISGLNFQVKGLILAQNERWRRGLGMQVERERVKYFGTDPY